MQHEKYRNKAGNKATPVACGWAGAVLENVTRASRQEQQAQKATKKESRRGSGSGNVSRVEAEVEVRVVSQCVL